MNATNEKTRRPRNALRREGGAVAIIVALSMTALVIAGGLVLDFGLVRVDRQQNKLAADGAVMAGLRAADKGSTDVYSEEGVCGALDFLRSNRPDLAGLPDGVCASPAPDPLTTCSTSTPFEYTGSVTGSRTTYTVTIRSPYQVGPASGFTEDTYPTLAADVSSMGGCDQIGVIIEQSRTPGLGSLASSSDLVTTIRSVGRVHIAPGEDAPAMLLLKRTGCPILETGSSAGGSWIHVYGDVTSDGKFSQPGTIHADSDGSGCSDSILKGRGANGIVAYAAPLRSNPSVPDPTKPGMLTTTAGTLGVGMGTIRDADSSVYSSGALDETSAASASKGTPTGRALVTRRLVDERYLPGVSTAVDDAWTGVFSPTSGLFDASTAQAAGFETVACDGGGVVTAAALATAIAPAATLTAADKLYVDCTNNNGLTKIPQIDAGTVVFNGKVNPAASINLPNAHHIYVFGKTGDRDAILLGNGSAFTVHTTGNTVTDLDPVNTTGIKCSPYETTSKAVLFMRTGQIKQTGGLLRLCNTTVFMLGGDPDGCLLDPAYVTPPSTAPAPAPTQAPCASTSMGTGQISQTGGQIDWTAPNEHDVMRLPNGDWDTSKTIDWSDPNGPEDLSLWSESAGNNSSTTYNMAGGGLFNVRGVFMVPNAEPFTLSGGANLNLRNAQYIATSVGLDGNTTRVSMGVDPYSAVTLPQLDPFTLVR